jgi:hypothetical protein
MLNRRPTVALAALLALPLVLTAQQPRPRRPAAPPTPSGAPRIQGLASPTELLNRRRELDLSPRQVARLDSLERTMVTRRRALADQARALRDSACDRGDRCDLSDSARRTLRDRMGQLRSRQVDTTLGRQAMAVLDSTQRGRVQGMRLGRMQRGMAMRRQAPGRRGGGFDDPRGFRGRGGMDVGPRPPRRGGAADRWAPRRGGPAWDDRDDRPRRPLPPMRRRGDDLDAPRPDTTR